jgi:hypothetical protein
VLEVTTSDNATGSLASLWFPRPAAGVGEPVLVPLSQRAALERLLEAARVRGLCERGLLTRQFERLAALARVLPPFDPRWGTALLSGLAPALGRA